MGGIPSLPRWCGRVLGGAGALAVMAAATWFGAPTASGATTQWSAMSLPFLKPGLNQFIGLACAPGSVNFCVAVGATAQPGGPNAAPKTPWTPLAEVWNGTWKRTPIPDPVSVPASLVDVSCMSPSYCLALGIIQTPPAGGYFVELWSGSGWSITSSPVPDATAVSCFTSGCVIVGSNGTSPVAASWNGQSWASVAAPPSGLGPGSCTSATQCLTVGHVFNAGSFSNVSYSFDGTTWSGVPFPQNASAFTPTSVSCASMPAPASCLAVGFSGGLAAPPADLWNQSTGTWTTLTPLTPRTPSGAALQGWSFNGDSCPATNECVAVGVMGHGGGGYPLAEEWNGAAWIQMKVSGGVSTDGEGFEGVSCPTTTFCVAFGNKPVGTSDISPVVASWGTPPGGSSSLLGGL